MKKVIIGITIVVVIGAGGFVWWNRNQEDDSDSSEQQTTTQTPESSETESEEPQAETEQTNTKSVVIEEFVFGPAELTVPAGTTVTWTNKDSVAHTVTPDEDGAFEGSDLLSEGDTFSVTFNSAGEFTYHCQPHPQMTGKIVVTQ